jgi:hypothetical protein
MGQAGKEYTGTRTPGFADSTVSDIGNNTGIYVGVIVAHDTSTRDGRLEIYIPQFGGEEGKKNATVSYASPYLGSTQGPPGDPQFNSFSYTKQTYGFFATPPDVGNQVLCCFPPGKGAIGFWFACITSNASKQMLPANGSVPWANLDPAGFSETDAQQLLPFLKEGTNYPAGEFNENNNKDWGSNWINNKRPINIPLTWQLIRQGLDTDPTRGAITSSIQRDPVSTVIGLNSPGRPLSSQDPKNDPRLKQKLSTGNFNPADFKVTGRLPGHSFVMDDGDIYGDNNLSRWRTGAGHQILMNDTHGFVYISNATGTAWIELTKDGDVLIYGQRDLSIRTQGNLMLHSDNNVSINARNNVQVHADKSVILEGAAIQASGSQALNLYGRTAQLKSGSNLGLFSGSAMVLRANGAMQLEGSPISLNGGGGGGEVPQPSKIPAFLSPDTFNTAAGYTIQTNSLQSICYKIPTHEPYVRGSVSAIVQFQQEQANVISNYSDTVTTIDGEVTLPPSLPPSTNVQDASVGPVDNPAPASAFIKQSDPSTDLGVLNNDQYRAYLAQVSYTSSGQTGQYGLDTAGLQAAGYVKPDTANTYDALSNPNNWVAGPGMPVSLQDFTSTQSYQDAAMTSYTRNNYAELQRNGVITASTSSQDTAGLLAVAHIAGASGAIDWYNGIGSNAVTGYLNKVYQEGRYSQTQVNTIIASNASKTVAGV